MINHALRRRRQAAGYTQRQMAEAAGMDLQTYSKKERGARRTTDVEACRFARVLGCRIEDIVAPPAGEYAGAAPVRKEPERCVRATRH